MYQFIIHNEGTAVAELSKAKRRQFAYKLGAISECSFVIELGNNTTENYEANLITPTSELRIYRDSKLIWAGNKPIIADQITATNKSVSIKFIQTFFDLQFRYATGSYATTQDGLIIDDILQDTQTDTKGGVFTTSQVDLGLTAGLIEDNQIRDRTYNQDQIWKTLTQLTDVANGGEFIFSPSVKRNTIGKYYWSPQLGELTDVKFSFEDNSISSVTRTINPRNIVNYVTGVGNGITSEAWDTDQERLNKFKMRQEIYKNNDISVQDTLDQYTMGIIEAKKLPSIKYDFKVFNQGQFGRFDIGDWVRFKVLTADTGGRWSYDGYLRVYEISVLLDDLDFENINLVVSETEPEKNTNIHGFLKNLTQRVEVVEKT